MVCSGGRILKDESLEDAFRRICDTEAGIRREIAEARFIGTFTHIYDTNALQEEGLGTHYVVLAYEVEAATFMPGKFDQHSEYRWFSPKEAHADIHEYSREYFAHMHRGIDSSQYQVLNARRDSFNSLLWQTPVLSLTAQAFLFTIILSSATSVLGRALAGFLSVMVALSSLQLLRKHRYLEENHAKILHAHEVSNGLYEVNKKPDPETIDLKLPSYQVWLWLLSLFAIAAIAAVSWGIQGLLQ